MLYKLNCFSGVFHFFKLTEFQECLFQIMSHDQKYSNFHILIHDIIIHKSFPEFFLSFQLGDGIRCLELEAQNAELSRSCQNPIFSFRPFGIKIPHKAMQKVNKFITNDIIFVQIALN